MADYNVSDAVDVRATDALPWLAGTVSAKTADRWKVTLTIPITANDWSGVIRRYGGTDTLTVVEILFQAELGNMAGRLIRTHVP